jgi:PBP1b-binding outer membrane lipoprotein LpoB
VIRVPSRLAILALVIAAIHSGCSSVGGTVSSGAVVHNSARVVTAQEWQDFAHAMLASLHESGVLDAYRAELGGPVPLMIGDFRNDTDRDDFTITKDVMINAIRKELVNTGRAGVLSDAGGSGAQLDRSIADALQLVESDAYDPSTVAPAGQFVGPRLTLSGQFINSKFAEGRVTQYDYACALRLVDNLTATTAWENQVLFPKQFERSLIGR